MEMRAAPRMRSSLVALAAAARRRRGEPAAHATRITVYAAASLTDVFPQIDSRPEVLVRAARARSPRRSRRARRQTSSPRRTRRSPTSCSRKGLVQKPVVFTRNRLVLVVPTSNPAGIHSLYDLRKPGIKLVIAAAAVPVGSYTLQVLKQMGADERAVRMSSAGVRRPQRSRQGRARRGGRRVRLLDGREDRAAAR